ncbi:MAG: hypothetical protein GX137_00410, partial [Thermoplasmatales archaeon]|nr:hypothetical protein [Thermoplasmatales archaeon]
TYVPGGTNDKMTVTGDKRTNAGPHIVTVSIIDKANYQWTDGTQTDVTFTFTIAAKDMSDAVIDPIEDQTPTGDSVMPEVTVRVGDAVLIEGVDYTVHYENNTEVGTATVTIIGIGNYAGTVTTTFSIKITDLGNACAWGTFLILILMILCLYLISTFMMSRGRM